LKRGRTEIISKKLIELIHESFNLGELPCTPQGFIRGGPDLVVVLSVSNKTIRNTSRLLEQLLTDHGLSAAGLNAKAKVIRSLQRRHQPRIGHHDSQPQIGPESQVVESDQLDHDRLFEDFTFD
jgi:hypothetical protein